MSSWINEAAVPNHNGNGFPHINDPSAVTEVMMDPSAFMGNPAQFNPQFANHQQMVMPNGPMRNPSPSFANPMYQTNSVVPSKRPRPMEDGMGQSPRPAPGMLPTSRAETPQQSAFPGFQQPGMPQQSTGQPSPYPHLQPNGSTNATPSPIMANQMRPGSVPQRVASSSPHPFSPAAQQFPQASPITSDHGGTPQAFMQQNTFAQNFNPQFSAAAQSPARPSPSPNQMAGQMMSQQMNQMQMGQFPQQMQQMHHMGQLAGQMPGQMSGQMAGQMMPGQMAGQLPGQMQGQMGGQMAGPMAGQMANMMFPQQMGQMGQPRNALEQQKLLYQMQLQQQAQRNSMQMQQLGAGQNMMQSQPNPNQGQAQAQARNLMAARQGAANSQMVAGGIRQQQGGPQQAMMRMPPPEQFMKHLSVFMSSKGLPLDLHPVVDGRPIPLYNLFQIVYNKVGGYRNTTQSNSWIQVSQIMGFAPHQIPSAAPQLRGVYERNLLKFEEVWAAQQKMRLQQQQGGMGNAPGMPQHGTPKAMPPGQVPPQMMQPGQQGQMPGQMQSPVKPSGPQQHGMNGFPAAAQPSQGQQPILSSQGHARNSLSRSVQATPTADEFPLPSPAQSKAGTMSLPGLAHPEHHAMPDEAVSSLKFPAPFATNPDEYMPSSRELTTYGGIDVGALWKIGDELQRTKIDVPLPIDHGNVDIHALTKGIQSGIHGEIRLALDTLASLTSSDYHFVSPTQPIPIPQIDLRHCEDLVDALIECAEEQMDLLVENSEEASDEIIITPYEEVVRACRIDRLRLSSVAVFGSQEYELDRAVDRLICITTILRNFSCREENHAPLADDAVIQFLCVLIRYFGTREMLLRTNSNALDLMKDLVTLLSNISSAVEVPGREQAFCLLQFLLAFAPTPGPTLADGRLFFAPYEPALHPYLPHAVDSLAKLLARDEPNRTHYKAIFAAETAVVTSPPCELLTRTFALAISPIPDHMREQRTMNLPSLVEARKPLLMQSLLSADILAGLAPGFESGVTRLWLASGNGFAQNLFLLARQLGSSHFEGPPPPRTGRGQPAGQPKRDPDLVYIIGLSLSLLRRLTEKALDPGDPAGESSIPPEVLPAKESVLAALQMQAQEWAREGILANLVEYACMAEKSLRRRG
ncbi:hypothetical protein N658DRAFT_507192 [Parathielavia hyrcaniae]|uniref:ARID domain-containing protein n=1 Tax=Parathielavia hyrcaniae TaxID=113614 RepID=A0AAN6Q0H0_9PEZI|nr:hypothetical protein N658DRAFT_507192 [Parathielavia hyrcaniae]